MAISYVQTIGTGTTSASTVSVTVPVGGVPAGHTLIACSIGGDSTTGNNSTQAISDSRANTYQVDLHTYDGTTINEAIQIASSYITTPLQAGDTITLTVTPSGGSNPYGSLAVYEFSGLAASSWLDQTVAATNTGGTTAPDSGATGTTTQASELVIGNFRAGSTNTFTSGAGYTGLSTVSLSSRHALFTEYKTVGSTGTQDANCTINSSVKWFAQCATYKALSSGGGGTSYANMALLGVG